MPSLILHPSLIFTVAIYPLSPYLLTLPKGNGTAGDEEGLTLVPVLKKHLGMLLLGVEGQECHLCLLKQGRTAAPERDRQTRRELPVIAPC